MKKIFDRRSLVMFLRMTILIAIAVSLFKFMDNADPFFQWLNGKVGAISFSLKPFFLGILLAYIFCPIVDRIEKSWIFRSHFHYVQNFSQRYQHRFDRLISVMIVYIALLAATAIMIIYLAPSIFSGLMDVAVKVPELYHSFEQSLMSFAHESKNSMAIEQLFRAIRDAINKTSQDLLAGFDLAVDHAFSFASGLVVSLFALIISAYFVYYKKVWVFGVYRVIESLLGKKIKVKFMLFLRQMKRKFIKYIIGKGLASAVLGVLAFIILTLMGCPYVALIAVLFAALNLIPFIGAFLGELIGALLACTVSVSFGLTVFLVLFALQQLDSFYLSPKLEGNALNLSPIWIIFSVFFFGALFGPWGMFFGAPIMAVILDVFDSYLKEREMKKMKI